MARNIPELEEPDYDEPMPDFDWHGETPEEVREQQWQQKQAVAMNNASQRSQVTTNANSVNGNQNASAINNLPPEQHYAGAQQQQPPQVGAHQLASLLNDPKMMLGAIASMAAQEVEQRMIQEEYRQKYPDFCDYEQLIAQHALNAVHQGNAQGQPLTFRQALDAGIEAFQAKYPELGSWTGAGKASTQTTAKNKMRGQEMMRLDVKGNAPSQSATKGKAIWKMSPDEFDALDDRIMRELNYYH